PDTGRAIGFDPRAIAAQHQRWKGDLAESKARRLVEQSTTWADQSRNIRDLRSQSATTEVPAAIAKRDANAAEAPAVELPKF
ncbi:hypothetical protein, partial [Enterobacter hormaechei]|uniref:hypothetical protein n=1 Tax=Enterobacter hormaechei TaxID=158836 RepID=UPI00204239B6